MALAGSGILTASACTDTMDRWDAFRAAEGGEAGQAGDGGSSASAGDSAPNAGAGGTRAAGGTGPEGAAGGGDSGQAGESTGGVATGGVEAGGVATGGAETGGERPGGAPSGGQSGEAGTGGIAGAGGTASGGFSLGGGGDATGGVEVGGCCIVGGSSGSGAEPDTGGSAAASGGGADVAGRGQVQGGAGGSSGDASGAETGGGTGGTLVFPILERAVLRDSASGDVSETTTFAYRGQCGENCVRYDALGLSLPQHDELELYVRVGPAHLSSELCWYYNHTPDLDQAGWKNVDGGCAEYVTEAGDLGVLVRQEHAVDAYFSALHDKNVSGPAPFLSFSHFEDGAHQYIWVYSAAAP